MLASLAVLASLAGIAAVQLGAPNRLPPLDEHPGCAPPSPTSPFPVLFY